MAFINWTSSGDTDWGIAANWSGGAVPGAGDDVAFDDKSTANCILDTDRNVGSLTVDAAYVGDINLSTGNITVTDGGNVTLAGGGIFDMGTGTMSLTNGDFSNSAQGTFTRGLSLLTMGGTGTLTGASGKILYALTIRDAAVITSAGFIYIIDGHLDVYGELICNNLVYSYEDCRVHINGKISGSSSFYVMTPSIGNGISVMDGDITVTILFFRRFISGSVIAPATYNAIHVKFLHGLATASVIELNGDYTFTGNVDLQNTDPAGSFTLDNSVNDPNIEIQGNLTITETAGTVSWIKGLGAVKFSGPNDQGVNFNGASVEAIEVDKTAGRLIVTDVFPVNLPENADPTPFVASFTTDKFNGINGTFDLNGYQLTVLGDCDFAAGFILDSLDGSTWIIGGNFTADGQQLSAIATWTLTVTGSAACIGTGRVEYSDASGGTLISASSWIDGGNNFNWALKESPLFTPMAIFSGAN